MNAVNQNRELEADELYEILSSEEKVDYAVPAKLVSAEITDEGIDLIFPINEQSGLSRMPLTDYASDQLHGRLADKGFVGYAQFLKEKDLRKTYAFNVLDLVAINEKTFRIRTIDNGSVDRPTARAVLSDRFRAIDDDIVFDTALPLIAESGRFRALGGNKTDTRTVMKFVEREAGLTIQSGNRLREFFFGFSLRNSEVGASKTEYNFFICDGWCSNGCTFGAQNLAIISYRHIGAKIETIHGVIESSDVEKAEVASIKKLIHDATMQAMTMEGRERISKLLTESANRTIDIKPEDFFKNLHKASKLTKNEVAELPLYGHSDELTQLGVQAAITAMAQHKPYERRLELEAIGGDILSMNDRQWNSVAGAE